MRQNRIWTDPVQASREDPDFRVQGEYVGRGVGLQLVALGDGQAAACFLHHQEAEG